MKSLMPIYGNQKPSLIDSNHSKGGKNHSPTQKQFLENRILREASSTSKQSKWLTTNEAANYLRITKSALKSLIYRGQVQAYKFGRRNRFLAEELDYLIRASS